MATGTVVPSPKFQGLDNNGKPLAGGKLTAWLAGTTTLQNTYSDSALSVPNTNPVILDGSGRATIYLTPGSSYKFLLQDSSNNTIWTVDNVLAVPASSATVDTTETAGQALTAGQVAYLSDGSGGNTAGQIFKADNTNPYSSSRPTIGIVPSAISAGASGTFRTSGQVTGLVGLTPGADYYVGTAGALVSTPGANARIVGRADSTTSLIITANPPASADASVCQGRLTLTSGTAITTGDVTGATSVYFTPYRGSTIALYDGANWNALTFAETQLALGTLTSGLPYDVFAFQNGASLGLELLAWTNGSTRATALALQNGVYVKSGTPTRRYLGTFYTTSTTATADSLANRYLWNYYNRVERPLQVFESTASWTYATATVREARGQTTNCVNFIVGVAEDPVSFDLSVYFSESGGVNAIVGIGIDTTTVIDTSCIGGFGNLNTATSLQILSKLRKFVAAGQHAANWLEYASGATVTFYSGTFPTTNTPQSGIVGSIRG